MKMIITIEPHPATSPEVVERMRRQLPDVLRRDMIMMFKHCVRESDWDGRDPEVSVVLVD